MSRRHCTCPCPDDRRYLRGGGGIFCESFVVRASVRYVNVAVLQQHVSLLLSDSE